MKRLLRIAAVCMIALAAMLVLSGCLGDSAEELYCLPQASERFIQLQEKINETMTDGMVYSPPTSGYNRQSVQLQDLDSDGKNEAIAFFKVADEKPLRIYVFREDDGDFECSMTIAGEGTAIDSIVYCDMDGDGILELVVGWQMNSTIKMLTMYSVVNDQPTALASADFSEYTVTDIDSDADSEIFVVCRSEADAPGVARLFNLMDDREMIELTANLSADTGDVVRIMRGSLSDGDPAVFVDSAYSGGVITDVFALSRNGKFKNVTAERQKGVSSDLSRELNIYTSDINGDGHMDVPIPRPLMSQSETVYYCIDWYSVDSHGYQTLTLTTYHNYSDGWYLIIPSSWREKVSVRREDTASGERAIVFSLIINGEMGGVELEDFLKLYTLTGDNKRELSEKPGRFSIMVRPDAVYSAQILVSPESFPLKLSEVLIKENFRIIYSEWSTGAI